MIDTNQMMSTVDKKLIISSSKRTKDWAINYMKQCIPDFTGHTEYAREFQVDLENYRLYNNQVKQEDLQHWCNPLGITVGDFTTEILPYNKSYIYINVLVGEEIKRTDEYVPVLVGNASILRKNEELRNAYKDRINAKMELEILRLQAIEQGMSEEEFNMLTEELQQRGQLNDIDPTNFRSELEITLNHIVDYCKFKNDIRSLKNEGFFHALISDKEVAYVGMKHGQPFIKVLNPLYTFFQKSPDEKYIQNGDWAGQRFQLTLSEVMREYGNDLSRADIDELEIKHLGTFSPGIKGIPQDKMVYHRDYAAHMSYTKYMNHLGGIESPIYTNSNDPNLAFGTHGNSYNSKLSTSDELVWCVHMEWKFMKKVAILTRVDELENYETKIIEGSYKAPEEATKMDFVNRYGNKSVKYEWTDELGRYNSLEYLMIPRIYEGTRIDENVYVRVREKPNQHTSITDPFGSCKLGYHGRRFNSVNAESVSMMSRMKPYQYLYFIAMHQMGELVSKNNGPTQNIDLSQIDPKFGGGDFEKALERTLYFQKKGLNIYNSASNDFDVTLLGNRAQPGNYNDNSLTSDILNMTQFLMFLEVEIGKAGGVSPERVAQFSSNTNVSDNQQSITQSSHITEKDFYNHNKLWAEIIDSYIRVFKVYIDNIFESGNEQEHYLQYYLPGKSIEVLRLYPKMLDFSDWGIFSGNSVAGDQYITRMEQLSLEFIQAAGATIEDISNIMKARVSGTSPEQVHRMIQKAQAEKNKREEALEQQKAELQKEMMAQQAQMEQTRHNNKMAEIQLEKELDKDTKLAVAEKTALLNSDADDNGVPDVLEIERLRNERNEMSHQMKMDKEELEIKKKELQLKEKDINAKIKIAGMKKQS